MSQKVVTKLGGLFSSVTRTSRLDFGSGPDSDLAYRWDAKRKLFSLAQVCALPIAIQVHTGTILCLNPSPHFPVVEAQTRIMQFEE